MRLIDGDEMLKRLEEWNTSDSTDKALYNFTLHRILEQPTIEPRCEECEAFNKTRFLIPQPQRTGRWIHDGYAFKGGIDWMHCSECGHKDSWSVATRTPFCGWCGARMEGEG